MTNLYFWQNFFEFFAICWFFYIFAHFFTIFDLFWHFLTFLMGFFDFLPLFEHILLFGWWRARNFFTELIFFRVLYTSKLGRNLRFLNRDAATIQIKAEESRQTKTKIDKRRQMPTKTEKANNAAKSGQKPTQMLMQRNADKCWQKPANNDILVYFLTTFLDCQKCQMAWIK